MFAFLFPGQGSQFVGMGAGLIGSSSNAIARVQEANDLLKFDIGKLILEGPGTELNLTANTQPAILLASVIATEALLEKGAFAPAAVAGHSLGEFSACWAAGVFGFADAIRIVRKRGELMQSATPPGEGSMAAVIGLTTAKVDEVCRENFRNVWPANFNSPEQTVIAGKTSEIDKAIDIMKANGAKKVVKLTVSAPFHTRFMQPARDGLEKFMADIEFSDPEFPVIRNIDAKTCDTADEIRDGLVKQVTGCVEWVDSMKTLAGMEVEQALELGPGKVLAGLMRRIEKSIKVTQVSDESDIEKGVSALTAINNQE